MQSGINRKRRPGLGAASRKHTGTELDLTLNILRSKVDISSVKGCKNTVLVPIGLIECDGFLDFNGRHPVDFVDQFKYMANPSHDEQVALARAYLSTIAAKRFRGHSYGLKHEAESYHRERGAAGNGYVSNGALIQAALLMGFRVRRVGARNPNAYIYGPLGEPQS